MQAFKCPRWWGTLLARRKLLRPCSLISHLIPGRQALSFNLELGGQPESLSGPSPRTSYPQSAWVTWLDSPDSYVHAGDLNSDPHGGTSRAPIHWAISPGPKSCISSSHCQKDPFSCKRFIDNHAKICIYFRTTLKTSFFFFCNLLERPQSVNAVFNRSTVVLFSFSFSATERENSFLHFLKKILAQKKHS